MTSEPIDPAAARFAYLVVVKRGDAARFERVAKVFAGPEVEVIWDRRSRVDRRQAGAIVARDRRLADRRRDPPSSWTTLGFLLAPREP